MLRALQWEKNAAPSLHSLLQRSLRPVAMAIVMLLMTRAQLLMRASPLSAAWMAAALANGESPGALAIGCLLGIAHFPIEESALLPVISSALLLARQLLVTLFPFRVHKDSETCASMGAGLAVLLPAMVAAGGNALASLQALACGALSACAAPFFYALLRRKKRRACLNLPEKTGAALLLGGCICAVQSVCSPAAQSLCALLTLLLPRPETGVLAGLALYSGGAGMFASISLMLCAWAAGSAFFNRKWQRAMAACALAIAIQLISGAQALQAQWMLCAAAIYIFLPDSLLHRLHKAFASPRISICHPMEIAREATRENQRRLSALSEAFAAMAENCVCTVDVPDEQELICEMRARLCAGCANYAQCWAGEDNRAVRLLCSLIGDALDRVDAPPGLRILFSDGEIPPDILRQCRRGRMIPDRLGLLLRDFAEKRRSEIKRCANGQFVSIHFLQAQQILSNLARFQAEAPGLAQLHSALTRAGLNDCEAVANSPDAASVTLLRSEKCWTRSEIARASRALGHTLGGKYLPRTDGASLYFVRAPRLTAESGSNCQSGIAGEACGDSLMVRALRNDKLLLAISDGMGSGEMAARESQEALRLLWRFLDAGISRTLALETVNRQLLMKSSEDMFATIDLCIIDLNTGIAEFSKLAASPTLILRGRELIHVDGGRLPLGILENVQPSVRRLRLHPGDMLIMGSDGVMEAGDGMCIEHSARENAALPPSQLAEALIRQAALQRSEDRQDDLSCICVRIAAQNAS